MAETISPITHEEEISRLKKELVEAVSQREHQVEKERAVMRGLVAKIKALDEEKAHLSDQLKEAQSLKHGRDPEKRKTATKYQQLNEQAEASLKKDIASLKNQVEELLLEKEESKKSLLHFMKEADEMKQELDNLRRAANADHVELVELRSKNAALEGKMLQLLDEKTHLEETAHAHEVATMTAEENLRNAKDEIENITTELNTVISERDAVKSSLLAELDGLSKEEKVIKEELENLREDKARAMQLLSEVEVMNKSLEHKVKDAEESIKLLKDMLQERDIEIDAIKKDLESLRTVNTELEDRSKKYVNVLSKTKKQILKLEKEKADALEQSTTVRAQWKDTVSEVKKLEEEVNRLKGSLQSAESETMILQKDRQQVVEEKNRIFEQLQIKQAEFEGSQSLAENLRLQLKECEHQIEEANERISANDDYQGLVESTKQELDTLKAQYSKEKRDWQRELEQCQIDLQNFKQDKESSWAQVQDLQAELESFQGQILDMQKALDAKIKEVESAHFDISDHVIRIRRLETELENSRQEAQTSQNMIQESLNKIAALEAINGEQKHELEDARLREGHLKKINKTLKGEIRRLSKAAYEDQTAPENISSENTRSAEDKEADDRINIEYLKNVILKFLENRSTRPQLIPVLTMMLKFDTNEIRRLQEKA